jgi:hypothetical protein
MQDFLLKAGAFAGRAGGQGVELGPHRYRRSLRGSLPFLWPGKAAVR